MLDLFLPNRVIDKKISQLIVFGWVGVMFLLWLFSPFVFLPRPTEVWSSLKELWQFDNLGLHLFTSVRLNVESILIGTVLSLIISYAYTINVLRPAISVVGRLRFLSMVGLPFFFLLITSSGHQLKVALLVFSIAVFFVTGMIDVIKSIPSEKYDLARTLGMGDWRTLYEVVVLGCADQAFDIMRQNAAIGFFMLTMVEALDRSEGGIGTLLLNQDKHFNLAAVFAIQLVILVVGLTQDYLIGMLKNMCCPYASLRIKR